MSTIIKHKLLCACWNIAPKRVKAMLYLKHRAKINQREGMFK